MSSLCTVVYSSVRHYHLLRSPHMTGALLCQNPHYVHAVENCCFDAAICSLSNVCCNSIALHSGKYFHTSMCRSPLFHILNFTTACRQMTSLLLWLSKARLQCCSALMQCWQCIWTWTLGMSSGLMLTGAGLLLLLAAKLLSMCANRLWRTCCPTLGTANPHSGLPAW